MRHTPTSNKRPSHKRWNGAEPLPGSATNLHAELDDAFRGALSLRLLVAGIAKRVDDLKVHAC